jgi:uncharacterized coiled-coil protein SlyX
VRPVSDVSVRSLKRKAEELEKQMAEQAQQLSERQRELAEREKKLKQYEEDIRSLIRLCDMHNIPIATNVATAEMLILGLARGDLDWRDIVNPKKKKKA